MKFRFTFEQKAQITDAILSAEEKTSGEIRVHIESTCKEDVMDHAAFLFSELQMHKTRERNGVLIYVSVDDHQFAIIGDSGINALLEHDFWNCTKEAMLVHFRQGNIVGGIMAGIEKAGEKLSVHFPPREGDQNELPNEPSFGS
jgi:uncharacterized membrane protein